MEGLPPELSQSSIPSARKGQGRASAIREFSPFETPATDIKTARKCNRSDASGETTQAIERAWFPANGNDASDAPLSSLGHGGVSEQAADSGSAESKHDLQPVASEEPTAGPSRGRYRKLSKWIETDQDFANEEAWKHAARIGRPLNRFVTLNLPHVRRASPEDRAAFWRAEITFLRNWMARHGEKLTILWNRSALDREGTGEHWHALIHVPDRLRRKFADMLDRRFGGKPAVVVRYASPRWWEKNNGRMQSVFNYAMQGIHPLRAANQNREYHYAGWITQKRCGWSGDLSPASIAAWHHAQGRPAPEWTLPWTRQNRAPSIAKEITGSPSPREGAPPPAGAGGVGENPHASARATVSSHGADMTARFPLPTGTAEDHLAALDHGTELAIRRRREKATAKDAIWDALGDAVHVVEAGPDRDRAYLASGTRAIDVTRGAGLTTAEARAVARIRVMAGIHPAEHKPVARVSEEGRALVTLEWLRWLEHYPDALQLRRAAMALLRGDPKAEATKLYRPGRKHNAQTTFEIKGRVISAIMDGLRQDHGIIPSHGPEWVHLG